MTSITPAQTISTGLRRRLLAVVVAVGALYAAAPPAASIWHDLATLVALAACAVALCSEERWRRLVLLAGPRGRGRHRAAVVALPRQRSAITSTPQAETHRSAR